MDYSTEMTCLLRQAQTGDNHAQARLYALVYDDLPCATERLVRKKGRSASASSLVHEGCLRLFRNGKPLDIPSRRYFFVAASHKMRDILRSSYCYGYPAMSALRCARLGFRRRNMPKLSAWFSRFCDAQ